MYSYLILLQSCQYSQEPNLLAAMVRHSISKQKLSLFEDVFTIIMSRHKEACCDWNYHAGKSDTCRL